MVLQSKVFLIALLQRYTPSLSDRPTLIRRVKTVLNSSLKTIRTPRVDRDAADSKSEECAVIAEDAMCTPHRSTAIQSTMFTPAAVRGPEVADLERGRQLCDDITPTKAMEMFTKIPFPEPRCVIHISQTKR
jgi:hypothetical protein